MILWKSGSRYYPLTAGAFVCDEDGRELAFVRDRAAVVAYLRSHPDRPFEIVGHLPAKGSPTVDAPDLAAAVLCGTIRYDSRSGALENRSFNSPGA